MEFEWQVPFIVIGSIALILFFFGRPKDASDESEQPSTGADLIDRLQRTLGIAIVVESVGSAEASSPAPEAVEPADRSGSGDPFTIQASFMYGQYTKQVVVGGPTESDAWAALARAAIEWRNSDFQHVQMWPGGG